MTSLSSLRLQSFALGQWQTNCYVLSREGAGRCWIIDAGFEPEALVEYVKAQSLTPDRLLLTHAHLDHIAGINALRDVWPNLPIAIHADEADWLGNPELNLSAFVGMTITAPPADQLLHHGESLDFDGSPFEIRHTPGHSPGGISLIQHDARLAIVGDALFAGSIGRTDFPNSSADRLIDAIRNQLLSLPDDTEVHPGHGESTTIGRERASNPWLQA